MRIRSIGRMAIADHADAALRVGGVVLAVASLAALYVAVRASGGTPNPLVHLAYVSIIVAAVAAGPIGGLGFGLAAGLLLGPLMPDSTATSATVLAQWGWLVRMLVYIVAGVLVALSWSWARRVGRREAARQVMREIINVVGRERTSLAACRRLLAELPRWHPISAASVYVFEADGGAYLLAGWSTPGLALRRREHHDAASAASLRAAASGPTHRRAARADVLSSTEMAALGASGVRSELVIPLAVDGVAVGVMFAMGSDAPDPLTDIERHALDELASGAASLARRAQQEEDTAARRAADLVRPLLQHPASIEPVFQPIMSIRGGGVAGYEALARFVTEVVEPPNVWFDRAAAAGLSADLQGLAIRRAREVAAAARLPMGSFLSINVSPSLLADTFIRTALAGDLRNIVIELTEEEAIADYDSLRKAMAGYRARGARFAIDDAGAGYASMRHVTELRPDFIKLDARLVTGLAGDDGRQALVRAMQSFAHDIGATLVAEGVETVEELALLARADTPILVQGYAVARPAPPWASVIRAESGTIGAPTAASRAQSESPVRRDARAGRPWRSQPRRGGGPRPSGSARIGSRAGACAAPRRRASRRS